jgi:bifunctional UDP-N-acetylglucosamine pyrophosphorylase/glucosamine-1-phosphate N-acetyltransferase
VQVILLAAGQSKRVKPIEDKNFLKFCGKYLICWQLENLKNLGLDKVLIVCNENNFERMRNFVIENKNDKALPSKISFSIQKDISLGMAGALVESKDFMSENEILVISSNDVVDLEAYKLILREKNENEVALIGFKVTKYFPGGYLELDKENFVKRIIEKPEEGSEPSDMVNLVIHYFKNAKNFISFLEKEIENNSKDDIYERALQNMIDSGVKVKAIPYSGFWQAIKFPFHVFDLMRYFFEKLHQKLSAHKGEGPSWISKDAQVSSKAIINGKVIIESGAKIFDNAIINGPAYIGKNSVLANNALLRDSVVGENCVIGFATEIARSFLSDDVWTHSNYIGDSFIGNNVSFGAGTVVGNLRLDEGEIKYNGDNTHLNKFGIVTGDNIRCGINVSFMPGLRIGSNSMIGGGIVINKDIKEKTFIRGELILKISENKIDVKNERQLFKLKMKNKK